MVGIFLLKNNTNGNIETFLKKLKNICKNLVKTFDIIITAVYNTSENSKQGIDTIK